MDENRIVNCEELRIGDEIIVPSNSYLRYYRVLREPRLTAKKRTAVRCSTNMKREEVIRGQGTRWERKIIIKRLMCTPKDHNIEMNLYDLNYRTLWLVRRNTI